VLEEDQAKDISKATCTKNLVKVAHVVPEIFCQTDRHTERQTDRQTYSSQYFATAPMSKVTMHLSAHVRAALRLVWYIVTVAFLRRVQIFLLTYLLVQAQVLCQMWAPYKPITAYKNFPLPQIVGPKNCGPRCCSTPSTPPLNASLARIRTTLLLTQSEQPLTQLRSVKRTNSCRV